MLILLYVKPDPGRSGSGKGLGSRSGRIPSVGGNIQVSFILHYVLLQATLSNWEILLAIWPLEDRPEQFRNKEFINSQPLAVILELKRVADELQKKGENELEAFKKDAELPTRHYDGGPDNCADLLHPAR